MRKTLFRETTEVPVQRSLAGIIELMVGAGATRFTQTYDGTGHLNGLEFTFQIGPNLTHSYSLPARTESIVRSLTERKTPSGRVRKATADKDVLRQQAERIAWRQLHAWVEAQVALVDSGMVQAREVFFPYLVRDGNRTMFEVFEEYTMKQLAAPEGK